MFLLPVAQPSREADGTSHESSPNMGEFQSSKSDTASTRRDSFVTNNPHSPKVLYGQLFFARK
jgi:hypothetical protein